VQQSIPRPSSYRTDTQMSSLPHLSDGAHPLWTVSLSVGFKHGARPLRHYTGSVVLLFSSDESEPTTALRSQPTSPGHGTEQRPETHFSFFADQKDGGFIAFPSGAVDRPPPSRGPSLLSSALGLCGLAFLSFVFWRLLLASCALPERCHTRPHYRYLELSSGSRRPSEQAPLLPAMLAPPEPRPLPHPYEEIK
jgi:hypothetical protein